MDLTRLRPDCPHGKHLLKEICRECDLEIELRGVQGEMALLIEKTGALIEAARAPLRAIVDYTLPTDFLGGLARKALGLPAGSEFEICPDCPHIIADHFAFGCQHLTPIYREGRLAQHDRCECRRGSDGVTRPREYG